MRRFSAIAGHLGAWRLWRHVGIAAGLILCVAIFVYQIRTYWFLTDDAFIAFRYARNLRNGYGLVFNPGFERVEGYTCFLWVLLLAGVQWATGWLPQQAANWILAASGVALWVLTVGCCWRRARARGRPWLVLVPALWLSLNRSVAVWCTSGLETKLFELLVVGAVLLGIDQVERRRAGWSLCALLLALAALTRPEGISIAGCFFATRLACEWWDGRFNLRAVVRAVGLFGVVIGAHFVWRVFYYGDLLPNTYYAKFNGESWWEMGGPYLRAFLLEYGAAVWLPFVLVGAIGGVRERRGTAAWFSATLIVPHALYVGYVGGDHFEFRPLDLYFPLLAVLLGDGVGIVAVRWRRPVVAAVWGVASCVAVTVVPLLTHLDFPPSYIPGFPGGPYFGRTFIHLERHPWVAAVPGMRTYVQSYSRDIGRLTQHFVCVRQEEHEHFFRVVEERARVLVTLLENHWLPRDTYAAMISVGVVPYFTDLRVLDMFGLTDRDIARQPPVAKATRGMAHARAVSKEYLVARGVDVIAFNVVPSRVEIFNLVLTMPRDWVGSTYASAPFFGSYRVIGVFPAGLQTAQSRFPYLRLMPLSRLVDD